MHLFLVYCIAMMNTPSLSFELGLSWKSPMAEQIILLVFNTFDYIARYMYAAFPIKSSLVN